jgi:hypothetical protein
MFGFPAFFSIIEPVSAYHLSPMNNILSSIIFTMVLLITTVTYSPFALSASITIVTEALSAKGE